MSITSRIETSFQRTLFKMRFPSALEGFPPPPNAELQDSIQMDFSSIIKELEINPADFFKFKENCGYANEYVSYMGDALLNEKLLEHYVSLEILNMHGSITSSDQLIDVGSAKSPFYKYVEQQYGCRMWTLDPAYAPGIHGNAIGAMGDNIPLPHGSVTAMTLHCTIDHFEGDGDINFVKEAARVLSKGGKIIILPVYFAETPRNLCDPSYYKWNIGFDPHVQLHKVSGYQNRFGRYYSPQTFRDRLLHASPHFESTLFKVVNRETIPNNYLQYALLMEHVG